MLYKQNLDTPSALSQLANVLRVPDKLFGFAGMKDKRGVTAQLCTAHRVRPERLAQVNARGNESLAVGAPLDVIHRAAQNAVLCLEGLVIVQTPDPHDAARVAARDPLAVRGDARDRRGVAG